MFKHYYKDTLIRTSKTHQYSFALLNKFTLVPYTCSSTMKGIEKAQREIAQRLNIYKAVKAGTYVKKDRWSYSAKEIEANCVRYYGSLDQAIAEQQAYVDRFIVVRLEVR